MTTVTTHVGTSVDLGPVTLFSHYNAQNPALNVLDTTSTITPTLQAGETRVRVGMIPTTDGTPSRAVFVDGLAPVGVGFVTVVLRVGGASGTVVGSFNADVQTNTEPPAVTFTNAQPGPEYPTPQRP